MLVLIGHPDVQRKCANHHFQCAKTRDLRHKTSGEQYLGTYRTFCTSTAFIQPDKNFEERHDTEQGLLTSLISLESFAGNILDVASKSLGDVNAIGHGLLSVA